MTELLKWGYGRGSGRGQRGTPKKASSLSEQVKIGKRYPEAYRHAWINIAYSLTFKNGTKKGMPDERQTLPRGVLTSAFPPEITTEKQETPPRKIKPGNQNA